MRSVGILGGMGPQATLLLMKKVFEAVSAKDDNQHIPLVVHQNTQVPSRIKFIIDGGQDNPLPVLRKMAYDLTTLGCDLLAMPCNTAHFFYQEIASNVDVPFLNMIESSSLEIKRLGLKKVGILASPAVRLVKVFDPYFEAYGLEQVYANDAVMLNIIRNIKGNDFSTELTKDLVLESKKLIDKGCDGLLIACTEISLLVDCIPEEFIWVDSLNSLTNQILLEAL